MRRIATAMATGLGLLFVAVFVLFAAVEALPGNPAVQALGANADPVRVAELSRQLGLDRPLVVRFGDWFGGLLTGDLGRSAVTRLPVGPLIGEAAVRSLVLGGAALAVVVLVAVPVGVLAGSRPGTLPDRGTSAAALVVASVPEFVLASVLIAVFAFGLRWFPPVSILSAGGPATPAKLVLPVVTLAAVAGAYAVRLIRAAVAEAAGAAHVEAARLAGVGETAVLVRHLLPSVRGQIAQTLALLLPYLAGGALVVETVFGYPGLGGLVAVAVSARDAVLLSGTGAVLATVSITGFTVANLVGQR